LFCFCGLINNWKALEGSGHGLIEYYPGIFLENIEENHEKPWSGESVSQPGNKLRTSTAVTVVSLFGPNAILPA
jgi:hypothetical protein